MTIPFIATDYGMKLSKYNPRIYEPPWLFVFSMVQWSHFLTQARDGLVFSISDLPASCGQLVVRGHLDHTRRKKDEEAATIAASGT